MSEATVKFGAVDDGLSKTIKQINKQMGDFASETKETSQKVNMSFAAMAKAGAALAVGVGVVKGAFSLAKNTINSFGDALDMGGRLSDLAARTGVAAGEILVLERAFQNTGAGAEKVGPSINKMQRAIVEAGQGVTTYQRAFDALGISLDDLSKQDAATQFQTIARAIAGTQDPAQRAATAMQIFGRAGAELLPLFGSMSSEIDTARGQLGLMPQIMNKLAERFDGISDKITVIKGKFVEFAAGVLSTVVPAIDLITEALSKFDAAKFGRDLANVFVGAGNAMKGFDTALQAIKGGEGMLAFKAVWASIKLQVVETLNSIYANFKGAMAAIKTLISESGISIAFKALFEGIANTITAKLRGAIADFLSAIGKANAAAEMRMFSEADQLRAENYFALAKAGFSQLGENATEASEKAKTAFKEAFDGAGEVIATGQLRKDLDALNADIQNRLEDKKVKVEVEVEAKGEFAKGIFGGMSAKGGLQLFPNLKSDKVDFEEMLKPVVKAGKETKKEAQAVEVALTNGANALSTAAEKLKMSEQIAQRIGDAMGQAAIDPGGRLQKQLNEALQNENFAAARRIQRQIAGREERDIIREQFGRKSLKDIAKEMGIDPNKMTSQDLRKMLAEEGERKRKEALKQLGEPDKPDIKQPEKKPPGKPKEDTLLDVVKAIKGLMQKLERKLPTPALV